MLGRRFCRPTRKMGVLGSQQDARGVGRFVLLSGSSGGFWRTSGSLVSVSGRLSGSVEA